MRRMVVLPHPEGPRKQQYAPSGIFRLTPSTASISPKRLYTPASSISPFATAIVSPLLVSDAGRPAFLNERDCAQASADDQKRCDRGHGAQRIERWRGDVQSHAPNLQRQRVERAPCLQRPRE